VGPTREAAGFPEGMDLLGLFKIEALCLKSLPGVCQRGMGLPALARYLRVTRCVSHHQ
jgi:hypothetical protein